MYREFGKTKSWRRILLPSIATVGLYLPFSAFIIYIALQKMELNVLLIAFGLVAFSIIFPLRHLRDLYIFPLVAIDQHFIVANQPLQPRRVYTLSKVTHVQPFLKSVFFLHNSFPALLTMNTLTKDERAYILGILNGQ